MIKEEYVPLKVEIVELNLENSILLGSHGGQDEPYGISEDGNIYNFDKIDPEKIEEKDPWDLAF